MYIIVTRTITLEFFKENLFFFLIFLCTCFGFLSGVEHKALIEIFISHPTNLIFPFILWVLYDFLILRYAARTLKDPKFYFLAHLRLIHPVQRFSILFMAQVNLFSPVVFYAIVMSFFAFQAGLFLIILIVAAFIFSLCCVNIFVFDRLMRHPADTSFLNMLATRLHAVLPKPYPFFFPLWLLKNQPIQYLFFKTLACLLIALCLYFFKNDIPDPRWISIGVLFGAVPTFMFCFLLKTFEEAALPLVKGMPVRISKVFLRNLIIVLILVLPETLIYFRYFPYQEDIASVISNYLFMIGILMFMVAIPIAFHIQEFSILKISFAVIIILFFMVMFSLPVLLFTMALIILSGYFHRRYYTV